MPRIVYDVTNLIQSLTNIPHGVVRVEAAFAEALLENRNKWHIVYVKRNTLGYLVAVSHRQLRVALDRTSELSENKSVFRRELFRISRRLGLSTIPVLLKKNDLYVNVGGLDQLSRSWYIELALSSFKIPYLVYCHDLIPVRYPYLVQSALFKSRYKKGVIMSGSAKLVLCNSIYTSADLREYFSEIGVVNPPVLTLNQLASSRLNCVAKTDPGFAVALKGGYILSVGAISERKNQDLLLNIWAASENDVFQKIKLVLVGGAVNGSEIELRKIELDERISSNVVYLERINDADLAWLYENCMFTLYPSLCEGWGLPVGESLAYGKVCIASSTTSVPEVGQGLCVHIDPFDFVSWRDAIVQLISDIPLRKALEDKIKLNFTPRSWQDVGREFLECISRSL
jgi:glycosyltransferase involved in cell wall biosynthesis